MVHAEIGEIPDLEIAGKRAVRILVLLLNANMSDISSKISFLSMLNVWTAGLPLAHPNFLEGGVMNFTIREEQPEDVESIYVLTASAFERAKHTSHTEHFIVNALRREGLLTVSLVAIENDKVIGHVAISPVTISPEATGWYGLGPISVAPHRQGLGVGTTLVKSALADLQDKGAAGCVVLGEPEYYGRFGFRTQPNLKLLGVHQEYFQALSFNGDLPSGTVQYHKSFDVTE